MTPPEKKASGFANHYLSRYGFPVEDVVPDPVAGCKFAIVIPSYDEPEIRVSVESLLNCIPPGVIWEILIVFNHPEQVDTEIKERNRQSYNEMVEFADHLGRRDVSVLPLWCPDLPKKQAGVGLARKRGMDTALMRFNQLGAPDGWIVGFDADTLASKDYLQKLSGFVKKNPDAQACNLFFRHPLESDLPSGVISPIVQYELHIRYFKLALESTGHPFAIHTVGSSFMVRADAYMRCGGMGRHQAGEDFYFLQKCVALGNFYELNEVEVFPSPRISNRVVFGTGASIGKLHSDQEPFLTYHMDSWLPIKEFISWGSNLWTREERYRTTPLLDPNRFGLLASYLVKTDAESQIRKLIRESTHPEIYSRKFFQWFKVFNILQFLHQIHETDVKRQAVIQAANQLATDLGIPPSEDHATLLEHYRSYEKSRGNRKIIYSRISSGSQKYPHQAPS